MKSVCDKKPFRLSRLKWDTTNALWNETLNSDRPTDAIVASLDKEKTNIYTASSKPDRRRGFSSNTQTIYIEIKTLQLLYNSIESTRRIVIFCEFFQVVYIGYLSFSSSHFNSNTLSIYLSFNYSLLFLPIGKIMH